ncbi:MAG: bifunctional DNA primase/polymerase [Litorilinea sp.]
MKPINMHTAAAYYAQHIGWYVFPCHAPIFDAHGRCTGCTCEDWRRSEICEATNPRAYLGPEGKCAQPGKCPACKWAGVSTRDVAQVARWWGHDWHTANVETGRRYAYRPNIGIDCGKSDLLVLDADSYKDAFGDLHDLLSFEEQATVTAITGNGGEHLIYARDGKPYGNSTRGLPAGIDIRGAGGYILGAPSLHHTGRRYTFEEGYSPRLMAPKPIPASLDAILAQATPQSRTRATNAAGIDIPTPGRLRRSVGIVERVIELGDFDHYGKEAYGAGLRWIFEECPFNPPDDPHPEDNSAFVIVFPDGRIGAGCHHNRCKVRTNDADSGWRWLCDLVGYTPRPRRSAIVEVAE